MRRTSRSISAWPRLAAYALTVLALISINFLLPRAMPGNPLDALLASSGTSGSGTELATRANLASYYGLDRPLPEQYGSYLSSTARGDLGTSIRYRAPVRDVILARLPWTVLLVSTGAVLATVVGLSAGVHSGWRRGRRADQGLLALSIGIGNVPSYVVASLAVLVFGVSLGWLPLGGATTAFVSMAPLSRLIDIARHLILPATVLCLPFAAEQYLVMRAGMVSELGADYLILGRAKGLPDRWLEYRYSARNALVPVVNVAAVQIGSAFAVTVFVETVFDYPGIGRLMFDAVAVRDYPVLQGCFLIISVTVVTLNAVAEVVHRRLDPRISG